MNWITLSILFIVFFTPSVAIDIHRYRKKEIGLTPFLIYHTIISVMIIVFSVLVILKDSNIWPHTS